MTFTIGCCQVAGQMHSTKSQTWQYPDNDHCSELLVVCIKLVAHMQARRLEQGRLYKFVVAGLEQQVNINEWRAHLIWIPLYTQVHKIILTSPLCLKVFQEYKDQIEITAVSSCSLDVVSTWPDTTDELLCSPVAEAAVWGASCPSSMSLSKRQRLSDRPQLATPCVRSSQVCKAQHHIKCLNRLHNVRALSTA